MNVPHLTQEKEQRILDAAQSRFARYGFSKVTMDEIGEDIGMGKASLYYYYPTKEHIFREVIRREQAEFLDETANILRQTGPASEKLRVYVHKRTTLGNEISNLSALSVSFWHDPKPLFRDLFSAFADEEIRLLSGILSEGTVNGEFSVPDYQRTAEMMVHALQGMRLRFLKVIHVSGANEARFDAFAAEIDFLVETILQGIVTRNEHEKG